MQRQRNQRAEAVFRCGLQQGALYRLLGGRAGWLWTCCRHQVVLQAAVSAPNKHAALFIAQQQCSGASRGARELNDMPVLAFVFDQHKAGTPMAPDCAHHWCGAIIIRTCLYSIRYRHNTDTVLTIVCKCNGKWCHCGNDWCGRARHYRAG